MLSEDQFLTSLEKMSLSHLCKRWWGPPALGDLKMRVAHQTAEGQLPYQEVCALLQVSDLPKPAMSHPTGSA
jgi:hypothetical protein